MAVETNWARKGAASMAMAITPAANTPRGDAVNEFVEFVVHGCRRMR